MLVQNYPPLLNELFYMNYNVFTIIQEDQNHEGNSKH